MAMIVAACGSWHPEAATAPVYETAKLILNLDESLIAACRMARWEQGIMNVLNGGEHSVEGLMPNQSFLVSADQAGLAHAPPGSWAGAIESVKARCRQWFPRFAIVA